MNADGAVRNAEVLLDQVLSFSKVSDKDDKKEISEEDVKTLLGIIDISLITKLIDLIFEKKSGKAVDFLNEIIEKGLDPSELAKAIVEYLRQALILKISPDLENPIFRNLTEEVKKELKEQSSKFKEPEIRKALKLFLEAQNKIKYSPIPQLPLELAILEIIGD
jgi:DNA polymerase-3 subunit gamma/tau